MMQLADRDRQINLVTGRIADYISRIREGRK